MTLRFFLIVAVAIVGCELPSIGTRQNASECPLLDRNSQRATPRAPLPSLSRLTPAQKLAPPRKPTPIPKHTKTSTVEVVPTSSKAEALPRPTQRTWRATASLATPTAERHPSTDVRHVSYDSITHDQESTVVAVTIDDVISSVLSTFPAVRAAALEFDAAQGQVLSAQGAFDTKLKAASENGPLGFYETYRHGIGALQPLAYGGEVFGGYRIGRGVFQPWYKERQTNEGGEFKAGLSVPLSRNVGIDDRRAGLRRADLAVSAADPIFRAEVIRTIQAASAAYWQWVAAAQQKQIAAEVLRLATIRNKGLEDEVEAGAKGPPVLKDNRRSILSREAKLIETERKLAQSAAKLSIFLRTADGEPIVPSEDQVPELAKPTNFDSLDESVLRNQAFESRPELKAIDVELQRIEVDLDVAQNNLLPNINAVLVGSQDMGEPASMKRDKSEFELEAALLVDVPLQRRKARGKLTALEAKQAQLMQKRKLLEDKIAVEVAMTVTALNAAFQRVERTSEARDLADYMAQVERENFAVGQSDLLAVALREENAAESASKAVEALLEFHIGRANLRAASAADASITAPSLKTERP